VEGVEGVERMEGVEGGWDMKDRRDDLGVRMWWFKEDWLDVFRLDVFKGIVLERTFVRTLRERVCMEETLVDFSSDVVGVSVVTVEEVE
jgi:hypothetical protein